MEDTCARYTRTSLQFVTRRQSKVVFVTCNVPDRNAKENDQYKDVRKYLELWDMMKMV